MVQNSEEPIWFKSKAWRLYAAKGHEIIVDDILFPWMQRNAENSRIQVPIGQIWINPHGMAHGCLYPHP